MTIAIMADLKPIPATRIERVGAPMSLIGKQSHAIETENLLRRALGGIGSCSYSSPELRVLATSWPSNVTSVLFAV